MTMTRIIGDIHGKFNEYDTFVLNLRGMRHRGEAPERSVQVGDFGIGFYTPYWHESVREWQRNNPTQRFIRGNHDDPAMCETMPGYIPDGTVEKDVMYVGGAYSIDHALRTEGVDWWRGEELTISQLHTLIDVYCEVKPRVMITHDCPTQVAWDMFLSKGDSLTGSVQIKSRTAEALQAMFDAHKPDFHFFGHWHYTRDLTLHGTRFVCLGELDYVDVDLTNSETTHKFLNEKFSKKDNY